MTYNPYNSNTMESDRRSNVSSFYRGRKDSFDALTSQPQAAGAGQARPSFSQPQQSHRSQISQQSRGDYQPAAVDEEGFNPYHGRSSEGHPRPSVGSGVPLVHSPPEEGEDQGWDVFNDFNNAGPRYGDAYGGGIGTLSSGYSQLPPQTTSSIKEGKTGPGSVSEAPLPEGVELVTVPALGPDWKKTEIEGMRSATHRAEKWDKKRDAARLWWRDQKRVCGLSRKSLAFILFGLCIVLAVALAICIPRVPGFSFNAQTPLSNATSSPGPFSFTRVPANFTFPALLNIQIDTHSNVIPLHISSLHTDIFYITTDVKVGEGDLPGGMTIGAKKFQAVSLPVLFNYEASNATDPTWVDFRAACANKGAALQNVRPGFSLRVVVTAKITGLLSTVRAATQIDKVECPFELASNAP